MGLPSVVVVYGHRYHVALFAQDVFRFGSENDQEVSTYVVSSKTTYIVSGSNNILLDMGEDYETLLLLLLLSSLPGAS